MCVAVLEPEAFRCDTNRKPLSYTRYSEFALSTPAVVVTVVRKLKAQVALGNAKSFLNLIERLMFRDSYSLPIFTQLTFIFHLYFSNYGCFLP